MAEADLYQPLKERLEGLLAAKVQGRPFRLEITARSGLSEKLKAKIPQGSEIIFAFLKKRPDLVGFIETQYSTDLITVEVKERLDKLDDLYQAKLYKEVFGARYGFLITAHSIPEEIKRLCRNSQDILHSMSDSIYRFLAIGQFDQDKGQFVDWFEADPFEKDCYW
jgi:hypothetical protein